MTNNDIKRIGMHECSHAVVTRLFRNRMTMEELVVHTGMVKEGEDHGTLHIRGPYLNNEQDFIVLAITYLAGVVGENMYLQGPGPIREKRDEVIADPTILDWLSGGGDIPSFENLANLFSLLYQFDGDKLKKCCLRFLIDFLGEKEIWFMIEKLCDELLGTEGMKLNEEELESAFAQIGLDALLDNKIEKYQKQLNEALQYY